MSGRRAPRRIALGLRRGGAVALLTAVIGLATAAPASAHPYLLSSDPAAGAVLSTAPERIDITYTEGLDRSYCRVVLIAPDGTRIPTRQVSAGQPTELAVVAQRALTAQGTYDVAWTAVGDDGHTVTGDFGFSVGHPSANPALAGAGSPTAGTSSTSGGAERLVRIALPFFTVLLAGILLLGGLLAPTGRRASRARTTAFAGHAGLTVALALLVIGDGGWSAFASSARGAHLIAQLALTAAVLPSLRWRGRAARALGGAAAVGLLVVLALSGHAATQPGSRRDLAVTVYVVHLLAVSIWIGALAAVVLRLGLDRTDRDLQIRRLRPLVAGSLAAVLVSGVATTDWALRNLGDLPATTYGKLAIVKASLFVAIVALGLAAGRRHRLLGVEAVVAAATLVVAGALGQIAQPLDQPYASQSYALDAAMPVAVVSAGADALDVASLAPGIVGDNTLAVEVGEAGENDFLSPRRDTRSVRAVLSCGGCGLPDRNVVLHASGQRSEWVAAVDLPRAANWLVKARIVSAHGEQHTATFAERVSSPDLPHQVVIGVPAAISGSTGTSCRDQVLGLQVALRDLNAQAADHGTLMRVVAVDPRGNASGAVQRLQSLGARVIAMPCGSPAQIADATAAARAAGLPVVAADPGTARGGSGVWSTQPSWQAEGSAVATQALQQGGRSVTAVVGRTGVDRAELAGLRAALRSSGAHLRVMSFGAGDRALARSLVASTSDVVALLGSPAEAAPVVHTLSSVTAATGWSPPRGILASAQLMSTDFINGAGILARVGGIEFASDINPFDPVSQYYAQRLRSLVPGLRPTFDGLHGYQAGLAIAEALKDGGGAPSAAKVSELLGTRFARFTVGSYRLSWGATGGTSGSLAFFRSTYVNPMAMPANAPGGAQSLDHEGTFLDSGGFEQVSPFREVA